jgi:GNAT superfamily N-acetyltransferase
MLAIINAAARAYAGVIPPDCYRVPHLAYDELLHEIAAGVQFWGCFDDGVLLGVMGVQWVDGVTLIRHAYVEPAKQRQGIGSELLDHLIGLARESLLVGTWEAATWAIRFYEQHGFELVTPAEKDRLLRTYWQISARQIATSVVLYFPPRGYPPRGPV